MRQPLQRLSYVLLGSPVYLPYLERACMSCLSKVPAHADISACSFVHCSTFLTRSDTGPVSLQTAYNSAAIDALRKLDWVLWLEITTNYSRDHWALSGVEHSSVQVSSVR